MNILIITAIVVGVIGIGVYAYISNRKRHEAMADLALKQGWTALATTPLALSQYLPHYLLNDGQNPRYDMAYQAVTNGSTQTFFQHQYTTYNEVYDQQTQTMRREAETHTFTIVNATLAKPQPSVMLLHHSLLSKLANFSDTRGMQRVQLEGDFNKSFDTYMLPDQQVEALSLLTPDVMVLLMDGLKGASAEFNGTSISASLEGKYLDAERILPLLSQVDTIVKKINL
jgi:hypothetical protein